MVDRWTARSANALREALGYSIPQFATRLGNSESTVGKWSSPASRIVPGGEAQQLLTVTLEQVTSEVRDRFWMIMNSLPREPGDQITIPVAQDLGQTVRDAAAQSARLADVAAGLGSDSEQLDHLRDELGRIAVAYVHEPLGTVVTDLRAVQNTVSGLLGSPRRPRSAHDLHFLGGVTCLMLAHASQNAGDHKSALTQLRAAATLAKVIDHDALRAWACGSAALMLEWSRRPADAVARAMDGLQFSASAQTRLRLLAIAARSAARAGDTARAHDALAQLRDVPTSVAVTAVDDVVSFGGLLSFPDTKLTYYQGGTYSLLGDHHRAEDHALRAIRGYEAGLPEDRSYGDEALARLDVTRARLAHDNIGGAALAAEPVLMLPEPLRIKQIDTAVATLRADVLQLAGRQHHEAAALGDQLTGYLTARAPMQRALPSAGA